MVANDIASTKSSQHSNRWLMMTLAATLAATFWAALSDDTNDADRADDLLVIQSPKKEMVTKDKPPTNHIKDTTSVDQQLIIWSDLKRKSISKAPVDIFEVQSWVVEPPIKKSKPPPPVAPPVPFVYIGKLEGTASGTQIFLMGSGKLYNAIAGQAINQQWRLEAEDANTLKFTYLPLNLVQIISKSAKSVAISNPPVLAIAENNE